MIASTILLGFLACGALAAPQWDERVIGGVQAQPGQIPYIISLKRYGSHSCGGSILDKNHVLTAAHCVAGSSASGMSIQYGQIDGSSKQNIIDVKSIRAHENYVPGGEYPNDIAVLTLAGDIQFGPNVAPTTLPTSDLNVAGDSIVSRLSGWGLSKDFGGVERFLLTAEFPLWNDEICDANLSGNYNPRYHVCAGDMNGSHKQCSGDSGGPLWADGAQQGVVSWSYKPCTSSNRPGVYTRVASHLDWIQNAMREQ